MADSATKHTPGPWKFNGPGTNMVIVSATNSEGKTWCVASMTTQKWYYEDGLRFEQAEAEAIANGHLIAAATELLEVCKEALEQYHNKQTPTAIKLAATIAKAEER